MNNDSCMLCVSLFDMDHYLDIVLIKDLGKVALEVDIYLVQSSIDKMKGKY